MRQRGDQREGRESAPVHRTMKLVDALPKIALFILAPAFACRSKLEAVQPALPLLVTEIV